MTTLLEPEFKAIKKHLKIASVASTAKTMNRSQSCIMRIRGSKNYGEYKELVKAEHTAKNPRKPMSVRIHNAKIDELMAIKARGRLGAYNAVCQRLKELIG